MTNTAQTGQCETLWFVLKVNQTIIKDGQTNGPTNGQTDSPMHGMTHPKIVPVDGSNRGQVLLLHIAVHVNIKHSRGVHEIIMGFPREWELDLVKDGNGNWNGNTTVDACRVPKSFARIC